MARCCLQQLLDVKGGALSKQNVDRMHIFWVDFLFPKTDLGGFLTKILKSTFGMLRLRASICFLLILSDSHSQVAAKWIPR